MADDNSRVLLSIVVPLYNEEESVSPLVDRLKSVCADFTVPYEIILVDDGSTDTTWQKLEEALTHFPQLRAIKFRSNCGQTGAMVAGFDHSRGDIIVTLDGDLQNDPADIPKLLEKLDDGYDVVSGWRKDRKDHWSRVFPSRVANYLISRTTGVKLHDYGCSLKAYRAECIRNIHCYGEMHRFFPALASMTGARVTEMPVSHHARQFGESKYGFNRIFKVFSDIFAINLIIRFSTAPLKGFVLTSFPFWVLMAFFIVQACSSALFNWQEGKTLFFTIAATLSLLGGAQMVALGILGELVIWTSDLSHTRLAEVTSQSRVLNGKKEPSS